MSSARRQASDREAVLDAPPDVAPDIRPPEPAKSELPPGSPELRPFSVMMLGLRSPFAVQGGIEAHVRQLALHLGQDDIDVEIVGRKQYIEAAAAEDLGSRISVTSIWSPHVSTLEAITHTTLGVFHAALRRPDVLHLHGIGPGLLSPLAKLFGLRVVLTHHGKDFNREKWGTVGKTVLRLGELASFWCSDHVIVVNEKLLPEQGPRRGKTTFIPNGVGRVSRVETQGALDKFGLTPGRYIINVARLVPEKRQLDLIEAVREIPDETLRLVLVGGADHSSRYARSVHEAAAKDHRVILTGVQTGLDLRELFSHAGMFILPSSHEGLPLALLEALQFGLPVLVSDLPELIDIGLPPSAYFPLGDIEELRRKTLETMNAASEPGSVDRIDWSALTSVYSWPDIVRQTVRVYERALSPRPPQPRKSRTRGKA